MNKKLVCCRFCTEPVYHSDGQFMWVADRRVNPVLDVQVVECPKCRRPIMWRRARKFIGKDNSFADRNVLIYTKKNQIN